MYDIKITKRAQKDLLALPASDYLKIDKKIKALASNPRPVGYKKLSGREAWRIRSGNYRIIYEIYDGELIVHVIRIRHRKNAYD